MSNEPSYLAFARVNVRKRGLSTWPVVEGLVDRIDRDAKTIAKMAPRTITTVEELDALPDASLILSEQGGVWEHQWDDGGRYWVTPGNSDEVLTSDKLSLPATVLYEPAQ